MISKMGQADLKGMFQAPGSVEEKDKHDENHGDHCWMNVEDDDDDDDDDVITTTSGSSLGEYSRTSQGSTSSSSDLVDDASSSTSNSSTICNGPLYEMSELMAQLPIKRGLSNHFQGKSQSFTSLLSVKSLEDLAKKETPYRKKMKACKSYGGGLDTHKFYPLPRATISKKFSRNSLSSSFPGVIVMWCLDAGFNADQMWWRADSSHPSNFNLPLVFVIYSGHEICNAGKWEVRHIYMSSSKIPPPIGA